MSSLRRVSVAIAAMCALAIATAASYGGGAAPAGEILFCRLMGAQYKDPALYLIAPGAASARLLVRGASQPAASPSGRRIAFVRGRAIWTMNRDASGQRQITSPPKIAAQTEPQADSSPAWSPDGRTIYFARYSRTVNSLTTSLFSVSAQGGQARQLTHPVDLRYGHDHDDPAPSPDGRIVVFTDTNDGVHALANTLSAVTPRGRLARLPVRLPARIEANTGSAPILADPAWSPDGKALAYTASDAYYTGFPVGLYISSTDRSAPRRLLAGDDINAPAWSPDGKWIVGFSYSGGVYGGDIWTVRSDGTGLRQITQGPARDRDPVWLPGAR